MDAPGADRRPQGGRAGGGGRVAVMVAMIMVAALGAKAGAVTDQTTCTEWGSANENRQNAYATLYVREHGPAPGWAPSPEA